MWSFTLPAPEKSAFIIQISHWTTASSVKSISGVTLHGNAPGNSKCPYFNTIILPTLEKIEKFQQQKFMFFFFRNLDPHNSRLNRKRVVIHKKKHTHVKKVRHTSKFLFGIYWWTLKTRKIIFLKKRKKIARDNHFTHVHRKLQSYEVRLERCRVRETNFFAIMGNFLSFYPTNNPKNQNLQKLKKNSNNKKNTWIYHHLTQVKPKIMIICYTVPEIWHVTDVIVIFHFGLFFSFLPTNNPKNQNFEKIKKNTRRYHYSTQVEP